MKKLFHAVRVGTQQGQRKGQSAFNALYKEYPQVADKVRGTPADPFYDDDKLPEFWEFVAKELYKS